MALRKIINQNLIKIDLDKEREVIAGQKLEAQADMLASAEVKKEILQGIDELQKDKEVLLKSILETKEELTAIAAKQIQAEQDFTVYSSKTDEERKGLSNILAVLSLEKIRLTEEVEVINDKIDFLQETRSKLNSQISSLDITLGQQEKSKKDFQKKIDELSAQVTKLQEAIPEKQNTIEKLDGLIAERTARLGEPDNVKTELDKLILAIQTKNETLEDLENKVIDAEQKVKEAQTKLESIATESNERIRVADLAETRLDQKVEYAKALIQKGEVDGYIKKKILEN